jgi:hypothetical protein
VNSVRSEDPQSSCLAPGSSHLDEQSRHPSRRACTLPVTTQPFAEEDAPSTLASPSTQPVFVDVIEPHTPEISQTPPVPTPGWAPLSSATVPSPTL